MAGFGDSSVVVPRDIEQAAAQTQTNQTNQQTTPKTAVNRSIVFKTICIFFGFLNLGLVSPLLGNTLVHLESLFDVSTSRISIVIQLNSGGYLAGSILCGFVYDRVNHELAFAVANIVMGLGLILAPFLGGLVPFMVAICIQAVSQGYIDAGGQSYSIELWVGHRYREPVVHAVHALWSLAGTVSPFIIARFLVDLPHQLQQQSASAAGNWSESYHNGDEVENSQVENLTSSSFPNLTVDHSSAIHGVGNARFAYVTIGSLVLVGGILFTVAFLQDRLRRAVNQPKTILIDSTTSTANDETQRCHNLTSQSEKAAKSVTEKRSMKHDRYPYLIFIALTFIFFSLYPFGETLPIAYMTTFTVKYLNFPIQNASLLMSLFFGFHFAGRVLGIPISVFLRPRTMLTINLALTALAFVLLVAFVNVWPAIIWISAPLAGVSMATTYATTMLWVGDRVPVTGALASLTIVGYSLGLIVGPLSVSQLFESSTPMWFVYILVIASISHVGLFFVFMVFDARCGQRVRRAATGENCGGGGVPDREQEADVESKSRGGVDETSEVVEISKF